MKKSLSQARSRASVDDRLSSAGLKKTSARRAVLAHLEAHDGPPAPSHADVTEALAPLGFDRVTVFRVLTDFSEAGLVRRLDMGDRVFRFELVRDDDDGARGAMFTCEACEATRELPASAVTLRAVRGAPKAIRAARVYLRGICDGCAAAARVDAYSPRSSSR